MKAKLIRHLSNIPGKSSKRKILVIESDDWGSIRMPSKEVCELLSKKGIDISKNHFTAYDSLETNEDLEALFEVLTPIKDKNGKSAVITPLVIMANPDFDAIKKKNFEKYVYEPFTTTAKNYKNSERILDLWKQGKSLNLFEPEFHGREHFNVNRWMKGLNDKLPQTMLAFENRLVGLHSSMVSENRKEYFPAFDIDKIEDLDYLKIVFTDGITMFRDILGFDPKYFVPPNGPFNTNLEPVIKKSGIKYINVSKIQNEPLGDNKFKKRFNYLGKKSKHGLHYLTRNVIFEPSRQASFSWVDKAISEIDSAYKWNKPAVISTHRINYIGRISEQNRSNGLAQLKELLNRVIKKWPDVEFMTSVQLGNLISK